MDRQQTTEYRKKRLQDFINLKYERSKAALGRDLGYRDGAFVGQMLRGDRPITEKTIDQIQALPGGSGWFSVSHANLTTPIATLQAGSFIERRKSGEAINLLNNPDYPAIRRVNIKLSAGASGFGVDYVDDDEAPIVFQRKWFEHHGYIPDKLLAVRVSNGSMEPGLYDGDTVIINTADIALKDGVVFSMNYEGELVVKRLVRDAGEWWLASDNPDQRRYPRKVCTEDVFCIGRIVHRQSERI